MFLRKTLSNFANRKKTYPDPPQGMAPPPLPPQGGVVTLTCARKENLWSVTGSLQVRSKSVISPFQRIGIESDFEGRKTEQRVKLSGGSHVSINKSDKLNLNYKPKRHEEINLYHSLGNGYKFCDFCTGQGRREIYYSDNEQ